MANKIILKHSSVVTDEKPKLPSIEQLDYGELAVNYADGHETITLKNTNNNIVEFKSKEYFETLISENELIVAESLVSINEDIDALFDRVRDVEENTPSAITESTVSQWGFTKNTGTITGIKMNGATKGSSGVVDLGTVITSHQDISGKQDKLTISDGLSLNSNTLSHADTNTNINADTSYGPTSAVTQSAKSTAKFKVPQITLDKFGHVKSVTEREITVIDTDTDTDTHYTTGIKAGASGTTANSSTTNPYIKVLDDTTFRSQIQLKGSGSTTVSSDANGVITISSTDTGEVNQNAFSKVTVTNNNGTTTAASVEADSKTDTLSLTAGDNIKIVADATNDKITISATDTNTHYTTKIYAGTSGTTGNTSSDNPYVKVADDGTYRNQIQFKGSGATTVKSDANGVITISSTDNDTKSFTITANAEDDDIVVLSGTSGTNAVTYKATHAKKGPSSGFTGSASTTTISGSGASGTLYIPKVNVDQYGHVNSVSNSTVSITMPTIPTALKNPYALTVGAKTYDGSTGVTINASDLGLESALKYHGVTTSNIVDNATTKPIVIDGKNHEQENGCVVFYGNKEFVWNGSKWEEFGNEGNYKVVQTAVSSPSPNGSTTAFIDTISQDTNGNITATKKNVDFSKYSTTGHTHTASFSGASGTTVNGKTGVSVSSSFSGTSGTTVNGKTGISVSSSFTGTEHKHTVKATGSISNTVTDNGHTHTFTPSGTVSSTFTGTEHTHAIALSDSYSLGVLTLSVVITGATASGTVSSSFSGTSGTTVNGKTGVSVSSTFSGNTVDSSNTTATGSISNTVTDNGHTHTFTPSGTVSSTVTDNGHTHTFTPSGSVSIS